MKSKSPWASKTLWGGFVMMLAFVLSKALGVEVSQEEQDTITANLVQAAELLGALVGLLMVVWGRYTAEQPVRKPFASRAIALMILPAVFMLASCGSSVKHQVGAMRIDTSGDPKSSTIIDAREAGSLTANTPGGHHYANFGVEGMEVFSPSPAGAAFIGQTGAALSDPKDASIESVVMDFAVYESETTGELIVYTKKVNLVGLNARISDPIKAQSDQWAAWVDGLKKIAEEDRAKFEAAMQTIESVAPDVADVLRRLIVPVP